VFSGARPDLRIASSIDKKSETGGSRPAAALARSGAVCCTSTCHSAQVRSPAEHSARICRSSPRRSTHARTHARHRLTRIITQHIHHGKPRACRQPSESGWRRASRQLGARYLLAPAQTGVCGSMGSGTGRLAEPSRRATSFSASLVRPLAASSADLAPIAEAATELYASPALPMPLFT